MQNPVICVVCNRSALRIQIENQLHDQCEVVYAETIPQLLDEIKRRNVACILVYPIKNQTCNLWKYRKIKRDFELIPIICICSCEHYELFKACADSFAEDFLDIKEIKSLQTRIRSAIDSSLFRKQLLMNEEQAINYPPRLKRALKLTHSRFATIKYTEEVSCQLGISVTTLRKEFKKFVGISFTQYLIQLRLLYAVFLSRNNGFKGKTIAYRCGFSGEHEFYRCFKRKMGLTFSKYRSKYSIEEFDQFFAKP